MPRYALTALIVACALLMENLDGTVISTSLPAIARDLHESPLSLKLALTSYLIALAVLIPVSGWMADRFGTRIVFRTAIVVFTCGSILCGLSSSLPGFVAARIIQGSGGAMMVPVGRLLLLRTVDFQVLPEPQAKLVRVLKGAVFDVAVDLREGSATYREWCGATLSAAEGNQVFIPRGFAHAYCTLEPDTIFAYRVDGYYVKASERGIRFNDPDIGIEWPIPAAEMIVSEKDAVLPFLRDAALPFRFGS